MNKLFPQMYDSPETSQAVGGLSYGAVAFVVLPFTFALFFFAGSSDNVYVGLECAYQKTNTVWAPVFTHAIVNALCCCTLLALRFAASIG